MVFVQILKVWDIIEHKCTQSITIKFPSFTVMGKSIEWGINSICSGPKRVRAPEVNDNQEYLIIIIAINVDNHQLSFCRLRPFSNDDKWNRSHILITCCNHLAQIKLSFANAALERTFTYPILQPPPLQNSVLVPNTWKTGNNSNELLEFNWYLIFCNIYSQNTNQKVLVAWKALILLLLLLLQETLLHYHLGREIPSQIT